MTYINEPFAVSPTCPKDPIGHNTRGAGSDGIARCEYCGAPMFTERWEPDPQDYVANLVATVERLNREAADADRKLIAAQLRIHKAAGICHRNLNMTICQQIAYALEGS